MLKFDQKYKEILNEIRNGKDADYDEIFDDFYSKMLSKSKFSYLKSVEQATLRQLGISKDIVEVSDSGNVVVKYAMKGNTIYLIGVLSKKAKLGVEDIPDMREWIEKLAKMLISGKTLFTSPNEISERMLKHVKTNVEKTGKTYHEEEMCGNRYEMEDSPYLKWKAVKIWVD